MNGPSATTSAPGGCRCASRGRCGACSSGSSPASRPRRGISSGRTRSVLLLAAHFCETEPPRGSTSSAGHGAGRRSVSRWSSSDAQSACPDCRSALVTVLSLTPRRRAIELADMSRRRRRLAVSPICWYLKGRLVSVTGKTSGNWATVRIGCDRVHHLDRGSRAALRVLDQLQGLEGGFGLTGRATDLRRDRRQNRPPAALPRRSGDPSPTALVGVTTPNSRG
jgi:hypothetical protein